MAESVNIDALPEELLGTIFRLKEPKERVGVEVVSRRWQTISRQYAWLTQTHLDSTLMLGVNEATNRSPVQKKRMIESRLKCLLERCSAYLTDVRLCYSVCNYLDADVAVDCIGVASNLTRLDFVMLPLTVEAATHIGQRLTRLCSLELLGCFKHLEPAEADGALAAILQGCRSLKHLNISSNATVTGETSLAHLPPTLLSLHIWNCQGLHASAVERIRSACMDGQLRELNVSFLPIDGPVLGMGRLFESLPLLEKLGYQFGKKNGTATLQEVNAAMGKIGAMRGLKSLNLSHNPLVTDEVLAAILDSYQGLEEFTLFQSFLSGANYTAAGLRALARLPRLTHLSLDGIDGLSEEELLAVVANAHLRELGLKGCEQLTDSTIRLILERCPKLRWLKLGQCHGVTRAVVGMIGEFAANAAKSQSSTEQNFHLHCTGSSIKTHPGELEAALMAAHPKLRRVRQESTNNCKMSWLQSLDVQW